MYLSLFPCCDARMIRLSEIVIVNMRVVGRLGYKYAKALYGHIGTSSRCLILSYSTLCLHLKKPTYILCSNVSHAS